MKIAQVAPLWENIPPDKYGGTERIVYYLTEELVTRGHDVTLFASGTCKTAAKLSSVCPRPLFQDNIAWTNIMYPMLNITEAFDRIDEFDIVHIHLNKSSDYIALPLAKEHSKKVVFTLHFTYPTNQNHQDRHQVLQKYRDLQYISISNSQRRGGENLNWIGTVYNGVDVSMFKYNENPKDYFFWLGKFNPDKGVKEAILAAKMANVKLVISGKVDHLEKEDFDYYQNEVLPLVDNEQIVMAEELNDQQKNEAYGNAIGFLNPIKWNEPFGLVMAESMATGTPVISFKNGAAPEIIEDGVSGYLVDNIEHMAEKISQISKISRLATRKRIEDKFTIQKMAQGYVDIYENIFNKKS
jgi:glycosyltransferase involved in cell wall biosynthesis